MATTPTKPDVEATAPFTAGGVPAWPRMQGAAIGTAELHERDIHQHSNPGHDLHSNDLHDASDLSRKPSPRDALQVLLAFSSLHEQVRRRKALAAARHSSFDAVAPADAAVGDFEPGEQFVLDEVLQLVAERALTITGADGLAIALAENNQIVLRAAAGTVRPDVGAHIDRDSAFSGACFSRAEIVNCDDTEVDPRVNLQACRRLGARSMVAVPLCGRRRVIGLIEAFSAWPFAFNESDIRNLSLLAELVVGALKPEDEDRFAESAQVAATTLQPALPAATTPAGVTPRIATVAVPPTQISITKPTEIETISAAAASILEERAIQPAAKPSIRPTTETEQSPALETAIAAEASVISETTAHIPDVATRRPGMLVLLVCIVIAVAFAAGVWWKIRTAQLANVIIRPENVSTETPAPKAAADTTPPASSAGNNPGFNPTTAVGANPDADSETSDADNSPATEQELSRFPRITGIRHWSAADSSTVVLDLEDQVQYEAHRLANPDRIYFDLHDTQLAADLIGKSIDVGDTFVSRVRVAQPVAGMTRIVLETKANTNFSVSLEPNPYRLLVEIRKVGAIPRGAVNLFPNAEAEKNRQAIVIPPPTKEDLQLRARVPRMRIVVDAGHGGWDLGTVGRHGLLEKDLVLEIAQRLGKLLESRLGSEVILTRNDDNYIPLDERAEIANQSQADLFVSVHANYSDLPSARGVETYYTNFFSAPGPKEAGSKDAGSKDAKENTAHAGADAKNTPLLTPADLHERIEQSRRLAASVQRSLYGTLSVENPGLRDRGIKEAGFVVLTESAMPGILAEVSFVSSPTDEQKLRSDGYREQIAEALYKGIARYAVSSKSVKVAERQSLVVGR